MNTYLVSYDLIRPGKDYSRLHEHLRSYPNWAKPLESVWFIQSNLGAEQLRNAIQGYMDSNDKILVVIVGHEAAWDKLPANVSEWIKKNL